MSDQFVLTLTCKDRRGIVAAVSSFLAERKGFVVEMSQFSDLSTETFSMRNLFHFDEPTDLEGFRQEFGEFAKTFGMSWSLHSTEEPAKLLLMVSKQSHCLNALLHEWHSQLLPVEIVGVVSNHPDLEEMCSWYKVPFYHFPISAETKEEQEGKVEALIQEKGVDLVVLARYMQILSADFVKKHYGRIINIHHSFLPSFKGAKPYHQAFARGVKLIGATAHYVSDQLDEGPIIEQEIARVSHSHSVEELVTMGRNIENITLLRAVKNHVEHRVFLDGHKTIVFK